MLSITGAVALAEFADGAALVAGLVMPVLVFSSSYQHLNLFNLPLSKDASPFI